MNKEFTNEQKKYLIELYNIGVIQFGTFTLKSGITSPIYIDLRRIISRPDILNQTGKYIGDYVKQCSCDFICGVPYTALPIATAVSLMHNKPMVMRRKEQKNHGTKKIIEGVYDSGSVVLVIEDITTSGSSAYETAHALEQHDLQVHDIVMLIDREQGGIQNLQKHGYHAHAIFTLSEILAVLHNNQLICQESVYAVNNFIKQNQL